MSQNVAELEKLVGAKLFERLRGEVALTGEGEVFKAYAEKMLGTCAEMSDMFACMAIYSGDMEPKRKQSMESIIFDMKG